MQGQQLGGSGPWPPGWFTDMPAVDLSGRWLFDADDSDPMLLAWVDKNPRYEITQQAAFIVLDFLVDGMQPNRQRYAWNGTLQKFERGEELVEEAARWTEAGRLFEIRGRSWVPDDEENRDEYSFTFTLRSDQLVFTQISSTGQTVWRFNRERAR